MTAASVRSARARLVRRTAGALVTGGLVGSLVAGCGNRLDNFGPHDATPTPSSGLDDSSLRWFADADSQLSATLMALTIRGRGACQYSSDPGPNDTYVIRACLNRDEENDYVWIWDPGARLLEAVSEEAKALGR